MFGLSRIGATWLLVVPVFALLLYSQQALGRATEQFGNAPITAGFPSFSADIAVLNDRSRVYWYEVNGDACFYYKGETGALNTLLKKFAACGKGREVILHAGPLKRSSLGGTKPVEAHWYIHVPGGFSLSNFVDGELVTDKNPAIHIYLPRARETATASAKSIAGWVADLDDDKQAVRENASRELEKQGQAVETALRKTLETTTSAEVRKRVRSLLGQLPTLNLDALVIPKGMTVVGSDELIARCTKGLKSKEHVIRGVAAGQLAQLEPDRKKAVERLLKVLKEDKNEYVRRSVVGALQREGWWAKSALPDLRALLDDPDVNMKNACKAAVEAIEKAKEEPKGDEQAKTEGLIRKDIAAYLKAREAKAAP